MNIRFEYLYRDAGNFKNWGEVVFSNKENKDAEILEARARQKLIDGEYFVVAIANVPSLNFKEYVESLDHGWHEFGSFKNCSEKPSDLVSRDIDEFIQSLADASKI